MVLADYFHVHFDLIQYCEFALRFVVACLCGIGIGHERSKRLKDAGLRTHMIVCAAAALMMIVSKYGFADLLNSSGETILGTKGIDPARIAAQVITGVGFLGAGVIFHTGNSVKGLTTAAGLWATAGIGLAIGAGMYGIGIFATLTIVLMQVALHKFNLIDSISSTEIKFTAPNTPELRQALQKYLGERKVEILSSKMQTTDGEYANFSLTIRMTSDLSLDDLSTFLEQYGKVKSISIVKSN